MARKEFLERAAALTPHIALDTLRENLPEIIADKAFVVQVPCSLHGTTRSLEALKLLRGFKHCRACDGRGLVTPGDLVARIERVNGDRFSFDGASLRGGDQRIFDNILCRVHGRIFSRSYEALMASKGCPHCAGLMTPAAVADLLREKWGSHISMVTPQGELSRGTSIQGYCTHHGEAFSLPLSKLTKRISSPCGACSVLKQSVSPTRAQTFEAQGREAFGNAFDYSLVDHKVSGNKPITLRCREHDEVFTQLRRLHLRGDHGCPRCRALHLRPARDGLLKRLEHLHPGGVVQDHPLPGAPGGTLDLYLPAGPLGVAVIDTAVLAPLGLEGPSGAQVYRQTLETAAREADIPLLVVTHEEWARDQLTMRMILTKHLHSVLGSKREKQARLRREERVRNPRQRASRVMTTQAQAALAQGGPMPLRFPPGKTKFEAGVNDLKTMAPSYLNEYSHTNPKKSSEVYYRSNEKVTWTCAAQGHTYRAELVSRAKGSGCPTCARLRAKGAGFAQAEHQSLLKDRSPALASEVVDESILSTLTNSSHNQVEWICSTYPESPHTYVLTPNQRQSGRGCPFCSFRKLLPELNSLGAVRPDLMNELIRPEEAWEHLANAKNSLTWHHFTEEGVEHIWEASVQDRAYAFQPCQVCSPGGGAVMVGINDLGTILEETEWRWSSTNDTSPQELRRGTHQVVTVFCGTHPEEILSREGRVFCADETKGKDRPRCPKCPAPPRSTPWQGNRSSGERRLEELLREHFPQETLELNVRRFRVQGFHEADLLLGNHVVINFDGEYWHQEGIFKPVGFHAARDAAIQALGLAAVTVPERAWIDHQEQEEARVLREVREALERRS